MSSTRRVAAARSGRRLRRLLALRRVAWRDIGTVIGYGFLVWTLVIVLFLPNGWLPFWTATAATVLLSLDRRLGPLPAALLMMLALPVGRGAEVGLPNLPGTNVPIRPHDVIVPIGVALSLPAAIRRLSGRAAIQWDALVGLVTFLAVGLLAIGLGIINDQGMRDLLRDVRWWGLYVAGIVAVVAGTPRSAVVRALVLGMSLYSLILVIGLLMPVFHGGLKWYAYSYDPRLRLHYGQAVFLIPAMAIVVQRCIARPRWPVLALIALLMAGVGVTLTRTLLAVSLGVATVVAIATAYEIARDTAGPSRWLRTMARRSAAVLLAAAIGIAGGFGTYWAGVQIWSATGAAPSPGGRGAIPDEPPEGRPVLPSLNRVFQDTASTGVGAQAIGRLTSYAIAFVDTAESPIIGHGMGQLARVEWAWGGVRAQTAGSQPGVDNAYLTVGLKAGAIGIAAFAAMMVWPLRRAWAIRRLRSWYVPAWLGLLALTLIQSYAVSGYAPFTLSLLAVLPALTARRRPGG